MKEARIAAAPATKEQNNFSLQSNILSYGWPAFGMSWIRKAETTLGLVWFHKHF